MYGVLAAWIIVLAGVLDRLAYAVGALVRRPGGRAATLRREGRSRAAAKLLRAERARADRGLARIDSVSRLATSVGLFGTVLGLAQAFFARTDELELAAPDVLAAGLATALFTTIGGLVVFLVGQLFLIAFGEWREGWERSLRERLEAVS
jgi:biopolymer transport protein ExbB/TolQ